MLSMIHICHIAAVLKLSLNVSAFCISANESKRSGELLVATLQTLRWFSRSHCFKKGRFWLPFSFSRFNFIRFVFSDYLKSKVVSSIVSNIYELKYVLAITTEMVAGVVQSARKRAAFYVLNGDGHLINGYSKTNLK